MGDDTTNPQTGEERPVETVLSELLLNEGLTNIFTYVSEDMMELAAELDADDATDVIHTRHEQDAIAMADGYARHTKDIGVCMVGQGGAIGQTGSALVTARKRGSNLLVVVPEPSRSTSVDNPTNYNSPSPGIAAKSFDQEAFLRDTIESVRTIRSPDIVIPTMKEAIRNLRLGKGPIAVQISTDVLNGTMTVPAELEAEVTNPVEIHTDPDTTVTPSSARIEEAIDAYLDSDATKHPLIVVGNGAAREEYRPAIEALAERMGAVLGTTFRGKGFFPDHPYYVGTVGETGNQLAIEYATEADYVLALGCGLNARTRDSGRLFRDEATLVQVDIDPSSLGRYGPIDIGIHGDARETVEMLSESLEDLGVHRADELWADDLERRISEHDPFEDATLSEKPDRIDPRLLVSELHEMLPYDRVMVVDGGHQARWVYQATDVHAPDHLICRGDFSTIGLSIPMGIGAASGTDDETGLVFCGDGSFMMHLPEVNTAARYDIPVIFVVINDDALAAEYHRLPEGSRSIARTEAPNIAEAASALGAEAHRVTSAEDLAAIASEIGSRPDGPVVIECLVDRDIQTPL